MVNGALGEVSQLLCSLSFLNITNLKICRWSVNRLVFVYLSYSFFLVSP